jgi:hypothetical protein
MRCGSGASRAWLASASTTFWRRTAARLVRIPPRSMPYVKGRQSARMIHEEGAMLLGQLCKTT